MWPLEYYRSLRSDASYRGQKKFFLLFEALPAVLVWLVLIFAADWLRIVPSEQTQYWLYSSIFQGLAALVAVTFAVLSLTYQRLEDSARVHLADASTELMQLEPIFRRDCLSIQESAKNWYLQKIKPIYDSLKVDYDWLRSLRSEGTPNDSSDKRVVNIQQARDDLARLGSYREVLSAYDNIASHLGRYISSTREQGYLPWRAIRAFTVSIIVIAISLLSLWLIDGAPYYQKLFVITSVYGALVAILYMWSLFVTMFTVLFGDWRKRGYDETKLPDPKEVYEIRDRVEEMLKVVDGT